MKKIFFIVFMLCTFSSIPASAKSRNKYQVAGVDEKACQYYLDQQIQWYLEEFNKEEDKSIFRFVPALRKRIFGASS